MNSLNYDYKALSNNYQSDSMIEFKYIEPKKGEKHTNTNSKINYLVFIIDGSISIDYNGYKDIFFNSKEMFLIPQATEMNFTILQDSSMMVLCFNTFSDICDRVLFQSLSSIYTPKDYKCTGLNINTVLTDYLYLLKHYICTGLTHTNLHALKQKELFMLLNIYYTKQELSDLFYYAIGKSFNFRSLILRNYKETGFSTELAKKCGYSYKVFIRKFREEFSETPYQWMQKQKACQIANILMSDTIPIKDIIAEFKFSSHAHLNIFCEKYIGDTAAEIRKKAQFLE